uniref:Uncharacterized protein n=2 Tax=Caenorhabditis japonica TaxID=281687 RepID=A0A8R1EB08_CAEJA
MTTQGIVKIGKVAGSNSGREILDTEDESETDMEASVECEDYEAVGEPISYVKSEESDSSTESICNKFGKNSRPNGVNGSSLNDSKLKVHMVFSVLGNRAERADDGQANNSAQNEYFWLNAMFISNISASSTA